MPMPRRTTGGEGEEGEEGDNEDSLFLFGQGTSTTVARSPGLSVSLSKKVIFPGISMSKRCAFRCLASRAPSGPKTRQVLKSFGGGEVEEEEGPTSSLSAIEPPTTATPAAAAACESARALSERANVGSEDETSSAYRGNESLP